MENKVSIAEQLQIPEKERRMTVGKGLSEYLLKGGFERVLFHTNIQSALPLLTRTQLEKGHAPTDAYSGRAPGMALGLNLPHQEMVVHVPSPIFPQEDSLLREIAAAATVPFPTIVTDATAYKDDPKTFIYPFIGSKELNQAFPKRTTPPAEKFNNKAFMRNRFKELGMAERLVPGEEIFYHDQSSAEYVEEVISTIKEYAKMSGKNKLVLKLAETASGLLSSTIHPHEIEQLLDSETVPASLKTKVESMFKGEDGSTFMGDVVLEDFVDYKSDRHTGDYNVRGYLLPDGQFIPLSVGRQICDEKGQYLGMIGVPTHNNTLVQQIGLRPSVLVTQMETLKTMAESIHKEGYYGPISLDCFCKDGPDAIPQFRDFNMREGGGTVPGLMAAYSKDLYGEEKPVIDVETKIESETRLSDGDIEKLLENLSGNTIGFYATTFMRYPAESEGSYTYTLKTVQPFSGEATDEASMANSILENVQQLNDVVGQGMGLQFRVAY